MIPPTPPVFPPAIMQGAASADPAIVLVCEHASNALPDAFGTLGLSETERQAHVAWDPGALGVAQALQRLLRGDLVAGTVSRLLYDCNRPPEAESAYPARSEVFDIPGNRDLSAEAKAARVAAIYQPFSDALDRVMEGRGQGVLITVHSFTPVYHGQPRSCEIGILHDEDSRLADLMLQDWPGDAPLRAERNVPYGPEDGVTHTLRKHGIAKGWPNVMLEIRNDLIATQAQQQAVARVIADRLRVALLQLKVNSDD